MFIDSLLNPLDIIQGLRGKICANAFPFYTIFILKTLHIISPARFRISGCTEILQIHNVPL
jgi:hypothetical protein